MLRKIAYWLRKCFIWAFEAKLIHWVVYEAENLIKKELEGTYSEKDLQDFGKKLIKKVAKQPLATCVNSCEMISKSSCDGLLDKFKLKIDPLKQEIKFEVDGSVLQKFDFIRKVFK